MSAPVAPRGGVFRRASFQTQNVLPAFAIHTYRTDDAMRSETLTIAVNHYPTIELAHHITFQSGWQGTGAPKSRWCPSVSSAATSTVRRWLGPLPGSQNCATHPPSAPSPEELPRTRAWKRPQYRSQRVPQIAQLRLRVALAIQLRIGISRRLVRVVLALCPVEVRTIPVIGAVLARKLFCDAPASAPTHLTDRRPLVD